MIHPVSTLSASVAAASPHSVRRRRGPLVWIAIVGCIAFAAFLALFSFDTPPLSIDFLMHNIPTMIILIGAALAWWRSWAGAAWLFLACIASLSLSSNIWNHWDWIALISGPPFVLAVLLAIDAMRHAGHCAAQ